MGFSRLLYPMQTLPLLIKHSDSKILNTAFVNFIWSGKRPRIALRKLMLPRDERGINLPNLRGYNISCLFRHVLDWLHGENYFSNWDLETELAHPWPLVSLLHTRYSNLPTQIKHSITLRDTIAAWKEVRKVHGLPFILSKYMPLWGHPEFALDNNYPRYNSALREGGIYLAKHIIHAGEKRWLSPMEILHKYSLPNVHHYKILQILSLCKSRLTDLSREGPSNTFDDLVAIPRGTYGVSILYKMLRKCFIKISHSNPGKMY